MASLFSSSDFVTLMGGTGSYRPDAVTTALLLAEGDIENELGHGLTPKATTEEYPWPGQNGLLMLKKKRLISVDTVIALHNLNCSLCTWESRTDCAVVYDSLQGIVRPLDCSGWPCCSNGCWSSCDCPARVRITYTHGFATGALKSAGALTDEGQKIGSAVMLYTLHQLRNVLSLTAQGDMVVSSWSSAGYSESRQFSPDAGGTRRVSALVQEARNILRDGGYIIKRAISIRGKRFV